MTEIWKQGYPSVDKFANENGIPNSKLYRILNGSEDANPRFNTLVEIAEALNCSLGKLFKS